MYAIKHSGFAMIMAIFVLVLVSLGGVMLLKNASTGAKSIGDKYVYAQEELLAMSATEFAVMRAQDFNTTGANCLNALNITINDASGALAYNANVNIQYSFKNAKPVNNQCNVLAENTGNDTMMLIDVTVTNDANLTTEPVRIHKRSWQKL